MGCFLRVALILPLAFCLLTSLPALAAPVSQTGSELQIAFWNIRDFSTTTDRSADFPKIALVLHTNDCVAIAELNEKAALTKLVAELKKLGGKWDYASTFSKSGNTPHSKEYYGFVFRSDKLWKQTSVRVLKEQKLAIPGVAAPYRFDREPAVCKFATLDGRLDFTMMVVHITWGDAEKYRQAEVCALTNYFKTVQNGDPKEIDVILTANRGGLRQHRGLENFESSF